MSTLQRAGALAWVADKLKQVTETGDKALNPTHCLRPLLPLLFILFLITGCKVKSETWIEEMLAKMEVAWIEVDSKSGGQIQRDQAVAAIAGQYFVHGMSRDSVSELLKDLSDKGFHIGERRNEGYVKWPEGNVVPYPQDKGRHGIDQIPEGMSKIIIRKDNYGREKFIIKKGVAISLTVDDTTGIASVKANIWANSI